MVQLLLHTLEVLLRDEWSVASGHADAEARIGPHISPVSQNIAHRYHAPRPVPARAQPLLIEPPGDSANPKTILQIQAEDVADNRTLLAHDDQSPLGSNAVPVRRPSQRLALNGAPPHRRSYLVSQAAAGALLGPVAQ